MTKNAHRYEDLAAYAREHDYSDVHMHAVQNWTKLDLLPRAQIIPWAFGRRSFAYSVRTGEQLLALCHYRYDLKVRDLDQLGAFLWLDRFEIPLERVRAGLASVSDISAQFRRAAAYSPRERKSHGGALRDAGEVAVSAVYDRDIGGVFGRPGLDSPDLTQGLADLLRIGLGEAAADEADEAGLEAIGQLLGLGRPAGRTLLPTRADRADPRLLALLAERLANPSLASVVAAATDEDLVWAREAALEASADWPLQLDLQQGPIRTALESTPGRLVLVLAHLAERQGVGAMS